MAVTTSVLLLLDGVGVNTARDLIGIQEGQGAKPATVGDIAMTRLIALVGGMGTGLSKAAAIGVTPDLLGNPDDNIQAFVGSSSPTSSILLTAANAMTTEQAMDYWGIEVGSGDNIVGPELIPKVVNFLQNLGNGMNANIIISSALSTHDSDQWAISAGGNLTL